MEDHHNKGNAQLLNSDFGFVFLCFVCVFNVWKKEPELDLK
jgi:hypothetical protein